jgi:hypothetical protein
MTLFTHFVFFVSPQAALAATPRQGLPWQVGDPLSTLAPYSSDVSLTDAPAAYALYAVQPDASGSAWVRRQRLPATLSIDAERAQVQLRLGPLPSVKPSVFHLGLIHLPTQSLVAVSNAFAAGEVADESRILRYRNYTPSLLGAYTDPDFACELRLPLRIDWPSYPTLWSADPLAPAASRVAKTYRLATQAWPAAWLEALQFALRHDEVLMADPLGGYESVQLLGDVRTEWTDSGATRLGQAEATLRASGFAPIALLYGLPAGGFDRSFTNSFSL